MTTAMRTAVRQTRTCSPQGGRARETMLQEHREYMKRWRANPANRERVVEARQRQNAKRKIESSRNAGGIVCAFCHTRPPVKRIERLVATRESFRSVFVPCCADCAAGI